MRIRDGLHLVLSGSAGFDLSDPLDCHAWLLDSGDGWLMVDAGAGRAPAATLAAIAGDGVDPSRVRWLLLTHGHADHAGGAAALRDRLGVVVIAGAATARMVASGDTAAIGLDRAQRAGIYPEDYRFRPCPIDREATPGDTLALGSLNLEVIAAPGHSHDHLCFRTSQTDAPLLLAGDALFWGGRVMWQDTGDCDVAATCETVRRLARLDFDALLPGHGCFSLRDGRRHAEHALARVQRLLGPNEFG